MPDADHNCPVCRKQARWYKTDKRKGKPLVDPDLQAQMLRFLREALPAEYGQRIDGDDETLAFRELGDAGPQRGDHVADEGRLRAVGHRLLLGPVGVERRAEPREVPGLERGRRAPRARDERVRRRRDSRQSRVPLP